MPSNRVLVTRAVDETDRAVLRGNVHPLATKAADRGEAPANMPMQRMVLLLRRSQENELALRQAIDALHDRNSASYHKWLTPQQFGAQWGASEQDIAQVTGWLRSHGFTVREPAAGRMAIEFSGTAGNVREAFHTEIHAYSVRGETHYANASEPEIPAALAPVVAGITTLNSFHPQPALSRGPRGIQSLSTHRTRVVHPATTAPGGPMGDYLFVGPSDAATIYDTPNTSLNPNFGGKTIDGSGAIIGIIGYSNISLDQLAHYRTLFGLPAASPKVVIDGDQDPGVNDGAVEAYLDTEVSNGLAPGATVYLYTAADTAVQNGVNLAILRAINDNVADVLSVSFTECEADLGTAGNLFYESNWEQAAAQGISVTVAAGDSGSAGCEDPGNQTEAFSGLAVNGLASTPFDIAVGGTDFAALAGPDGNGGNFTMYASESNETKTQRSAYRYIPEVVWNDTIANFPPGPLGDNTPPAPSGPIYAGGGGHSSCAQVGTDAGGNPVCTEAWQKPSWQAGPSIAQDHVRDLPDISLLAGNGRYSASWGICTDQDYLPGDIAVKDCTPGSDGLAPGEYYLYGVGGTSASAPAMAGILALVRQALGDRQGQANYVLYNIGRQSSNGLHDVTTGNNAVPCRSGSPNCALNAVGGHYLTGYDAGAGYDLGTGLGSVDVTAMIANWAAVGRVATTTQLALAPSTVEHGATANAVVTVTRSGGGGPGSGEVALLFEALNPLTPASKSIGNYTLDARGQATIPIQIPGQPLALGEYKLIADFGGSADLAASFSAPALLKVITEASVTPITVVGVNPVTGQRVTGDIPYGYYLDLTAAPYGINSTIVNGKVQPDGTPTGTVTFAASGVPQGTEPLNSNGIAVLNDDILHAGAISITASYSGDDLLRPSLGAVTLPIAKAATQLTLSASTTTFQEHVITFNVALKSTSAGVAPTGAVELRSGTEVLALANLVGRAGSRSRLAAGEAALSLSKLPAPKTPIVAVYLGDSNYAEETSNVVTITAKPRFVLANTTLTVPGEHTGGVANIVTTSQDGYAGTIDYTCALVSKPSKTETSVPECAMLPATETVSANGTVSPQILVFGKGTKLPAGATLGSTGKWLSAGGAVLACCLLFGIPARRPRWRRLRSTIGVVLLLAAAAGGLTACSGRQGGLVSAGYYTFQVTGTDSKDATINAKATVTVKVL